MAITDTPVDNGVNVQALLEAREALSAAPEAAQFKWRATNTWVNGTHSQSTVEGFFGLGGEQHHKTTMRHLLTHRSGIRHYKPNEISLANPEGAITASSRPSRRSRSSAPV